MTAIRLATFNVENLFARWRFKDNIDPAEANVDGWSVDKTKFEDFSDTAKKITGQAVREVDADVLCLQEVEGVGTLKHFHTEYLGGRASYPSVAGIDGNEPRLIDVAVLSRLPISHVRLYQHLLEPVLVLVLLPQHPSRPGCCDNPLNRAGCRHRSGG